MLGLCLEPCMERCAQVLYRTGEAQLGACAAQHLRHRLVAVPHRLPERRYAEAIDAVAVGAAIQ